jgi:hypothetical protein
VFASDITDLLAVFTFGGSGPALTAHGVLDLKQGIQIQTGLLRVCFATDVVTVFLEFIKVDGEN